jgi:hypothetical protein
MANNATMTPARLRWKHLNTDPELAGTLFVATVFGVILSFFGSALAANELRYLTDGVVTDAQVVGRWIAVRSGLAVAAIIAHGGGHGPRHMIRYEFRDAAGQIQSGSADLDFGEWQRLVPGATVRIEYLRSDPARNRPALAGDWLFLLGVGLAIGGVTALFGGLAFLRRRIRVINEQVRLTLKGRPVLGLVEAVERHAPRKSAAYLIIRYRYLVEDGGSPSIHAGEFRCRDRRPIPWTTGDTLLVLVDAVDPARHAADRFRVRPQDLETLRRVPNETPSPAH